MIIVILGHEALMMRLMPLLKEEETEEISFSVM